jgi:hypothetical protein
MVNTLDLLYLTLTGCSLIVTIVLVVIGVQLMQVLKDVQRIAAIVEGMSELVDRIAKVVFPGIERSAKHIDGMGSQALSFIEKKIDKLTK